MTIRRLDRHELRKMADKSPEPSQDDKTDKEMALSFLQAIDEAECSLQAWNFICNAIEHLK